MKALGAPGSFLLELFGDRAMDTAIRAKADPLLFNTPLFTEVTLAKQCGLSLSEYRKLPRIERRILYFHHILTGKKEERSYEKSQEDAQRKAAMNNPVPKSSFR